MKNGTNNQLDGIPQEAEIDYSVYLESLGSEGDDSNTRKTLAQLFEKGEGNIVIPRRRIKSVSDALARFGI